MRPDILPTLHAVVLAHANLTRDRVVGPSRATLGKGKIMTKSVMTCAGRRTRSLAWVAAAMLLSAAGLAGARPAWAATQPTLDLKVLLIGNGASDPTTGAWESALSTEGVPYTEVTAAGTVPNQTVTFPALSSGSTGFFNAVVIADDPADFGSGQLSALDAYESQFGVRQLDGYAFPTPATGQTFVSSGALDGSTGTLTSSGLTAFPELKGPIPFDTGTFGYWSTAPTGSTFTPLITNSAGDALAGVYQHPSTDAQAGVSELALNFDYNAFQLQWLLLSPGLINWVTKDTHLGLYRNYFGQDIDDTFISDNEWSSTFQCTPAATDPPDYTCPAAEQGVPPGSGPGVPADQQMSAADVAYVTSWEQQTGIKLNLAFNAIGACTAPTTADESNADCSGSVTENGTTYTDPGQQIDTAAPNDQGLVNALLANKGSFNWINHTWSHMFLGCTVWQPQPLTSATAGSAGNLAAGTYSYEITAATAYGESEPSPAQQVTVAGGGSATLSWPDAPNGTGAGGNPGPSLATLKSEFGGGTGFWGYDVYRENPGSSSFGLIAQVPESSSSTYTFTDAGTATPGAAPGSSATFPTATDPGIDCSSAAGSWLPVTSTTPDSSIGQEIGLNQAFAGANGLANFDTHAVVTGEHSGLESPNMPAALNADGITTFAQDASRQPQQYALGGARGAPRYPSNIYYNASNWPDQLSEYNTLYVQQGHSIGNGTGRCVNTSATTCRTTPATEADVLAIESRTMLGHVLGNNPRVGYAHQSNLIGPATQNGQDYGYTILSLISNMLSQYNTWYKANTPIDQMTDTTEAQVLGEQGAWAQAQAGGNYTASVTNGTVTITNNGAPVAVPVTVPAGTSANGAAFGQAYGGQLSDWVSLGTNATETLTEKVAPTITSPASATSNVGAAFSFMVTTAGSPAPGLTESGALPSGLTFTDNGDGTATIAGTPAAGSGGTYVITIAATNAGGTATQNFTLTNTQAPTITSPATATFATGTAGSYKITTTGYPAPKITETGTLPSGLKFTDNGDGTGAIAGTPAAGSAGSYAVTISASNSSGSTATLNLTITVQTAAAPTITSASSATFAVGKAGTFTVTTTGTPTARLAAASSPALPSGVTFTDNGNGTATIAGTPPSGSQGAYAVTITAGNTAGMVSQEFRLTVSNAPAITSAATVTETAGTAFSYTVATTGYPAPALTATGLPAGVSLSDNGHGTGTLSGTNAVAAGTYSLTVTAANGGGSASQTITLTVNRAGAGTVPAFTSPASDTVRAGTLFTFTATTAGSILGLNLLTSVTEQGPLPAGLTLTVNTLTGTLVIAGTPTANGTYPVTLTATNSAGTVTQAFVLTVQAPPAFSTGSSATATVGSPFSFMVGTSGTPTPALTESGALPPGLTFTDNGDGTATLGGAPTTAGTYTLTIKASNSVGSATQTFTVTVN